MHDSRSLVRGRLKRFRQEYLPAALYRDRTPLTVQRWDAPGEPVPFAEAARQAYLPFDVSAGSCSRWGKPWGTTWFKVTGEVPQGWVTEGVQVEAVVDLGFNEAGPGFQAEGTAYAANGQIIKGLEPLNMWVPLDGISTDGKHIEFFVEAAANPFIAENGWFIPTPLGSRATAGEDSLYEFRALDLAQLDQGVWELAQDVEVLAGYLEELPQDSTRVANIREALSQMLDAIDPRDLASTAAAGREALAPALASPAVPSAHRIVATGHAHIDSAWLWPTRETVRKCARTFSNVVDLMDDNPDLVFSCSSAQQFEWVREHYPALFERIKEKVAAGQFVPVGGMWVESDTNLPGGEALARQLIEGKRFFLEHFKIDTPEVWLPDSFGYTAAMPQLVKASGSQWFLTQKISWNDTNTMPHHTFQWEGIDGTRVFTHFPPVDTYNSDLSATEMLRAERQFRDKGKANISLVPFGWGDGGGGPTREMVAAAHRQQDLEGAPRIEIGSARTFFEKAEADYVNPPVWSGELYLEYHRGTYTSQARTKRGNRRSEHLLREAELWAATAAVRSGHTYPQEDLRRIWRIVLLNQFHDILPGSSISWVYEDAERQYAEIEAELEQIIDDALNSLIGEGDNAVRVNAGPRTLDGVPALGASTEDLIAAKGSSTTTRGDITLESEHLRVVINANSGDITSIRDLRADRELIPEGHVAGALQLFEDIPNEWDAWDVNEHYRRNEIALAPAEVQTDDDAVIVTRATGSSHIQQRISISDDGRSIDFALKVDWKERQRMLKLAFPLDLHADHATSEIQFGHVKRPIHQNTSWDAARFETCAHRWIQIEEPGYGVAISNDATYGHDFQRLSTDSGLATLARLSILRAPQFPDPDADTGEHTFHIRLSPGATIADAVSQGYALNLPVREVIGANAPEPLILVDNPGVVVESVKLADDGSGDVVVRAYEAHGARNSARIVPQFDHDRVAQTDFLEREIDPTAIRAAVSTDCVLDLRPFQLVTLRFYR